MNPGTITVVVGLMIGELIGTKARCEGVQRESAISRGCFRHTRTAAFLAEDDVLARAVCE